MQIRRYRNRFGVAENLDALLRLVQDHGAVFAMREVSLEFLFCGGLELPVDVIRNLANDPFAIQFGAP
jgi:hypothetical protein